MKLSNKKSNIAVAFISILLTLFMLEVVVRLIYPEQRETYTVLHLQPNKQLGWIHASNFDFRWMGSSSTCPEFDVQIHMNNYGFRDEANWQIEKANNTIRIALLGDSHVEAAQVPFYETAAEQLEQLLTQAFPELNFEVMNFGVSNYSVGQFQLAYEFIASEFNPDYVFVYTAYFQMVRSLSGTEGSFISNYQGSKNIRPTYILDELGELVFIPQEDSELLESVFAERIQNDYGADRTRINPPLDFGLFLLDDVLLNPKLLLATRATNFVHPPIQDASPNTIYPALDLNYAILRLLASQVRDNGAELIFVDTFSYFERYGNVPGSGQVASRNEQLAMETNMGYIDLSSRFRQSEQGVLFPCDGHLNANGNFIFAQAMFDWLVAETNFQSR